MTGQIEEQKFLSEIGYNLLMRYNPEEDKLTVDSKEPEFEIFDSLFSKEMRYKNLETKNEEEYQKLYDENMNYAKRRYEYYKKLENKE